MKQIIGVRYFAAALLLVIIPNSILSQQDKDRQQYDLLERDVIKDLDKQIAKFKPTTKAIQTKANPAEPKPLNVESSYDKFKDVTTATIATTVQDLRGIVNAKLKDYIAFVDVYATYTYLGQQPVKPTSINLVFKTFADGPFFGFSPSLIVIADNRRLRLGNMSQTVKRATTRSVDEFVSISIPYEIFAEIANADLVEVQIGNIDFPLSELNLKGFRIIAGLPDKPTKPNVQKLEIVSSKSSSLNEGKRNIGNSFWQGEPYSAKFSPDGTFLLNFNGASFREGTWRQNGDRIEIELPKVSLMTNGLRGLGIGIIKNDKLVIKIKSFGLLGSPSYFCVMEFVP